jgi:hypothetical protein
MHCKKKVSGFPVPSRDVTYQTYHLFTKLLNFSPARESLESDILTGDGKTANLFYSVVYWVSGRLNGWRGLIDILS